MKGKSHPTNDQSLNLSSNLSIHDVIDQAGASRRRFIQTGLGSVALASAGGLTLGGLINTVQAAPVPPGPGFPGIGFESVPASLAPVADRVYADAYLPMSEGTIGFGQALGRAAVPVKTFMLKQVREPDLTLFAGLAKVPPVEKAEDLPMRVVIPAFVTSELKTAFQIGFIIFIPFIIIDMVVASVLMSMGMMMMSPVIVSLPFKIMLFVLVDGWTLLIGSLVQSFAV